MHPGSQTAVQIVTFAVTGNYLFFCMFLLPFYLNKRFDPFFGPKPGERWEFSKSPAVPYYMIDKARDYAKAILNDQFAKSKFSSSREFCRSKIHSVFIPICRYSVWSERVCWTYLAVLAALMFLWK